MNVEEIRTYILSKKGVSECFPFDAETLVFKVADKMFALIPLENTELSINLKCTPERSIELREEYFCIKPGYHMNKKHWNTVTINGELPNDLLTELIDHSYQLVFEKLSKKTQNTVNHS